MVSCGVSIKPCPESGEQMNLLISACLLGVCCRYDGASKPHPLVEELAKKHTLIPICPEQMGGLATPRPPAERQGERVVTKAGRNVTAEYRRGAEEALRLCRLFHCDGAILKERSPSCGHGEIYDGTFTGTLLPGNGMAAELLLKNGISVYGESQIETLLT